MRHVTRMTINDAEHISPERRAEIIDSYPPHEREARIKGIPALGSGRIYPIAEEDISVAPFPFPPHWGQIAGMDIGWDHPTAAVKIAWDRDSDVMYVVACYRRSKATPLEHAATLRNWGEQWWAWPMDALQAGKRDGRTIREDYVSSQLNMLATHATHADGGVSVEAGVIEILTRMQTGRFKVFANLADWFEEFRLYHRSDGKIVKDHDDLMDATRYAVMMRRFAEHALEEDPEETSRRAPTASGY
jgi:hypothetical protein